jgi:hypothetical protein
MPLRIPVIATVPNGPALNVCGGAAVDSGAVMEGFGSGVGVEGAAAGACAGASPAGACCCPRAGRLRTAISTNVRRPPHCFFKVTLLSTCAFVTATKLLRFAGTLRGGLTKDQRNFSIELIQNFFCFVYGFLITFAHGKIDWTDAKNSHSAGSVAYPASSRYHLMSSERPLSRPAR